MKTIKFIEYHELLDRADILKDLKGNYTEVYHDVEEELIATFDDNSSIHYANVSKITYTGHVVQIYGLNGEVILTLQLFVIFPLDV